MSSRRPRRRGPAEAQLQLRGSAGHAEAASTDERRRARCRRRPARTARSELVERDGVAHRSPWRGDEVVDGGDGDVVEHVGDGRGRQPARASARRTRGSALRMRLARRRRRAGAGGGCRPASTAAARLGAAKARTPTVSPSSTSAGWAVTVRPSTSTRPTVGSSPKLQAVSPCARWPAPRGDRLADGLAHLAGAAGLAGRRGPCSTPSAGPGRRRRGRSRAGGRARRSRSQRVGGTRSPAARVRASAEHVEQRPVVGPVLGSRKRGDVVGHRHERRGAAALGRERTSAVTSSSR